MNKTFHREWTYRSLSPNEHIALLEDELARIPNWRKLRQRRSRKLIAKIKKIYGVQL